jgi:hypothetical protein
MFAFVLLLLSVQPQVTEALARVMLLKALSDLREALWSFAHGTTIAPLPEVKQASTPFTLPLARAQ